MIVVIKHFIDCLCIYWTNTRLPFAFYTSWSWCEYFVTRVVWLFPSELDAFWLLTSFISIAVIPTRLSYGWLERLATICLRRGVILYSWIRCDNDSLQQFPDILSVTIHLFLAVVRYISHRHNKDPPADSRTETWWKIFRCQIQGHVSRVLTNHQRRRVPSPVFWVRQIWSKYGFKQQNLQYCFTRIGPAVLRQSTYGTIKFGIYYTLKNWIGRPNEEDMLTNIFCGVIAGAVSSAIANPTDVLKVRMQACCSSMQQKSISQCFQEVYRYEGISGLWRVS